MKKVHLIKSQLGYLCVCDDDGEILDGQIEVDISEKANDEIINVTVKFAIEQTELMYEERNENLN